MRSRAATTRRTVSVSPPVPPAGPACPSPRKRSSAMGRSMHTRRRADHRAAGGALPAWRAPAPGSGAATWRRPCSLDGRQATRAREPPGIALDREALPGESSPMSQPRQTELAGSRGRIVLHEWPSEHPRYIALIAHGYGEHAARYGHVADHLVRHGGAVYAPDHLGHGRSEGERALIERADAMVEDLEAAARKAGDNPPELPVVLIGHSMGGIVAARFAQRHASQIAGLVLSGPAIGGSAAIAWLRALDPLADVLVDPSALPRGPEVGRAYAED